MEINISNNNNNNNSGICKIFNIILPNVESCQLEPINNNNNVNDGGGQENQWNLHEQLDLIQFLTPISSDIVSNSPGGGLQLLKLNLRDPDCSLTTNYGLCSHVSSQDALNSNCCYGFNSTESMIFTYIVVVLLSILFFVFIVLIQKYRRCKAIHLWRLQSLILIGAIIEVNSLIAKLYNCWFSYWMREIGFVLCFGLILLVHYKSLVEWRTRKAHRWIVREKDLLRYLLVFLIITTFYLTSRKSPCTSTWYRTTTAVAELTFILVGLHQGWLIRRATNINNKYTYIACLLIEFVVGLGWLCIGLIGVHIFYLEILRLALSPGLGLVVLFAGMISSAVKESKSQASAARSGGTQRKIFINSDLLSSLHENVNLDEMDPGEIRSELKRVYTQLELLRSKTMRLDNPHISKRRGGRKLTGGTHRRFSIQRKSVLKSKAAEDKKKRSFQQPEPTDYIEDSICSREID